MRQLVTVQKREKLNAVFALDEKGNGGANHVYRVISTTVDGHGDYDVFDTIKFQDGGRKEEGSKHGIIDSDLIEIVLDRMKSFQAGPFSSRENAIVITKLEEVLMWMNRRVEDRIERNVLGTNHQ
jgi:hypothetical protein